MSRQLLARWRDLALVGWPWRKLGVDPAVMEELISDTTAALEQPPSILEDALAAVKLELQAVYDENVQLRHSLQHTNGNLGEAHAENFDLHVELSRALGLCKWSLELLQGKRRSEHPLRHELGVFLAKHTRHRFAPDNDACTHCHHCNKHLDEHPAPEYFCP